MKKHKIFKIAIMFNFLLIMISSCGISETDACIDITCENDGICIDGDCDCPDGFTGVNCENLDASNVQALLDSGKTPKELFDGGLTLEQLYGNIYEGGYIFYLNTADGTGMVAATENQSNEVMWGCNGTDIIGLPNVLDCALDCFQPEPEDTLEGARIGDGKMNTEAIVANCSDVGIGAQLCNDLELNGKSDWFLPSRGELNLMYVNLYAMGHGDFPDTGYMSSSELGALNFWYQNFGNGVQASFSNKQEEGSVRAARSF